MSNDIEMENLADVQATGKAPEGDSPMPKDMDSTISWWAWTTATLCLLLSSCLILFPRLLLFFAETSESAERRTALTPLESFLALHFGVLLAAVSVASVLNVPSSHPVGARPDDSQSHPLLGSLSPAFLLIAFISYNTTSVGSLAFLFFIISAIVGTFGLWTILFAGSSSTSKKTGADKHTSAFIFGNKSAASVQKKQWRKEQKAQKSS